MTNLEDLMGRSIRMGNLRIKEQRFVEQARILTEKYYKDSLAAINDSYCTPEEHHLEETLAQIWKQFTDSLDAAAAYRFMPYFTYDFQDVPNLKTHVNEYRTKSFGSIVAIAVKHTTLGTEWLNDFYQNYDYHQDCKKANVLYYSDQRDIAMLKLILSEHLNPQQDE